MIEAKDLRIGNLVYGVSDRIEIIKEIHYKGGLETCLLSHPDSLHRSNCEDINGIPLSDEWLIRLGADKLNVCSWNYALNIGAIRLYLRQNTDTWYSELGGIYTGDRFKYVHDIQNVRHSLTGQELTLTHQS